MKAKRGGEGKDYKYPDHKYVILYFSHIAGFIIYYRIFKHI